MNDRANNAAAAGGAPTAASCAPEPAPPAAARRLDLGAGDFHVAKKARVGDEAADLTPLPSLDEAFSAVLCGDETDTFAASAQALQALKSPAASPHVQASVLLSHAPKLGAEAAAAAIIMEACLTHSSHAMSSNHANLLNDVKDTLHARGLNHATKASKKISTIEARVHSVVRLCAVSGQPMHAVLSSRCVEMAAVAHAYVVSQMQGATLRAFAIHACMGSEQFVVANQTHLHAGIVPDTAEASTRVFDRVQAAIAGLGATTKVSDVTRAASAIGDVMDAAIARCEATLAASTTAQDTLAVFKAHNVNCPESPPRNVRHFTLERAGSPQHLNKKQGPHQAFTKQLSLPFGLVDHTEAVNDYYLANGHHAGTQSMNGFMHTHYVRALASQAAEFKTNYVNGMPAEKVRRAIADPVNSPRHEAMFKFVVPHMAMRHVDNATSGEGMFPAFDRHKRIEAVLAHFNATMDKLGDRKLTTEAIARIVPKTTSAAVFMNHITTTLLCTGVVDNTLTMDATFVAIDLVRSHYRSRSHDYTPGHGIMCLRESRVYVITCNESLCAKLTALVDQLSSENHELRSPELLIDHALIKSTLVMSAGRPCTLTTLNAGMRTAVSEVLATMTDANVVDLRHKDSLFEVNPVTTAQRALRSFICTHGNADAINGTHTALKVYMQQTMSKNDVAVMKKTHVAAIHPNAEMFSCGSVYSGQDLFLKLTNTLTSQHESSSMLDALSS